MDEIPTMLKIHEAASKFNLSFHFTRQLVIQRKIKYVRAGNRYLINEKSLCDYLNEGEE